MSAPKSIRVLVADDHDVVRQGLCCLLGNEGHFEVVGEARNGREAVELSKTLAPTVVLMDIAMPLLNGLEATRQILSANPAARVIILSAHSDDVYVERMSSTGAVGFIEKQSSAELLSKAIRTVAGGGSYFSPAIERRRRESQSYSVDRDGQPKAAAVRLTSRETEVLQLVAEGQANKQVAATLGISIKTVEKHRQHLMDKLNIHETASLTRYAIEQGIVESRVRLTVT